MESERQSRGIAGVSRAFLIIVALIGFDPDNATRAADVSKSDTATEDRVQALIPAIEAYIASGMRGFDVPGLALGIVAGDKLIYPNGSGVRSKSGVTVGHERARQRAPIGHGAICATREGRALVEISSGDTRLDAFLADGYIRIRGMSSRF